MLTNVRVDTQSDWRAMPERYKVTANVSEEQAFIMASPAVTCTHPSQCTWHHADRVGATASLLCAIHCALLPLVIGLLPLIGLEILADPGIEFAFVLGACTLASVTIVHAWWGHRDPRALRMLLPGVGLLLLGQAVGHGSSLEWLHAGLMACGGTLVASAHIVNLRMARHRRLATAAAATATA